jgi:hypothetical protein
MPELAVEQISSILYRVELADEYSRFQPSYSMRLMHFSSMDTVSLQDYDENYNFKSNSIWLTYISD